MSYEEIKAGDLVCWVDRDGEGHGCGLVVREDHPSYEPGPRRNGNRLYLVCWLSGHLKNGVWYYSRDNGDIVQCNEKFLDFLDEEENKKQSA